MKASIRIAVRAYPVEVKDARTGEHFTDSIVLDKNRLQAGAVFDLSDEDIICRIYNRQGYRVLDIGKPDKQELTVDLYDLYFRNKIPGWDKIKPEAGVCDAE